MRHIALLSLLLLAACRQSEAPKIQVSDAWARAATAVNAPAAAYLTISNDGGDDRLISIESDRGTGASLHLTRMSNGMMEMRPLPEGLAVPGHGEVRLEPNGTHVMLDNAGPLAAGDQFNLVLKFEMSAPVNVPVTVVAPGSR